MSTPPRFKRSEGKAMRSVLLAVATGCLLGCASVAPNPSVIEAIREVVRRNDQGSDTLIVVAIEAERLFQCSPSIGSVQLASQRLGWRLDVLLVGTYDPRTHRAAVAARIPVRSWLSSNRTRRQVGNEPDGTIALVLHGKNLVARSDSHRSATEFLGEIVTRAAVDSRREGARRAALPRAHQQRHVTAH
jgi:hypothetical protein